MRPSFISTCLILLTFNSWGQLAFKEALQLDRSWYGQFPYAADFDNDGKMDLLHFSTVEVEVLYNNGSHDFTKTTIEISSKHLCCLRLTVGDLNADGKTDFTLYKGFEESSISIFLSNGRGFTKQEIYFDDEYFSISQLAIIDFDKDGATDIVAASYSPTMYFLKGDGSGEFRITQIEAQPMIQFAVADLNSDGLNDIIGTSYASEIDVYLAGADGIFTLKEFEGAGGMTPLTLAIGDFNSDDVPDVVATALTGTEGPYVTNVYFNDGNANFTTSDPLPEALIWGVNTIDYDQDGKDDLVASASIGSTTKALRNNGDETFTSVDLFENPYERAIGISVADFDQDGDEEIICGTLGQLVLVKSFVEGAFVNIEEESFGRNPRTVLSSDMNRDGFKDLIVGNAHSKSIEILYGDADYTFSTNKLFEIPSNFWDLSSGDFNSDGFGDIAYVCNKPQHYIANTYGGVLLSTPSGEYNQSTIFTDGSYTTTQAVDFNMDGNADLFFDDDLYINDGTGHFAPGPMDLDGNFRRIVQDLDNDGFPDAIVSNGPDTKIGFNDGHGRFTEFTPLSEPSFAGMYLKTGYINQDQLPDILIGGPSDNPEQPITAKIYLNKGYRQFEATDHQIYYGQDAAIADFNLDGRNDIITVRRGEAHVHQQNQYGEFTAMFAILNEDFFYDNIGVDDLDGDGKIDFYTFDENGELNIYYNDTMAEPSIQSSGLTIQSVSDSEVTATFSKGNGSGRLLLLRQRVGAVEVPANNQFYNFSPSFPAGATIGDGNHVVLGGDVSTVYVSDLDQGTDYELFVFEYATNRESTKISYNVIEPSSARFKTKRTQAITIGNMSDVTFGASPITVDATATSGLPITLTLLFGEATVTDNQFRPGSPGVFQMKLSQPGNNEYMPAPDEELTFCVFAPVPTISVNKNDPAHPVLTSSATTNNQWQEDGTDIPGATNRTLEPEGNGLYSVKVSYAGCARTSLATALIVTGVSKEDSFSLFPNPATNQLTITVQGTNDISNLTMLDMHGQRVSPGIAIRGNTADVDIEGLAHGIYVVQVACGGEVYQQKVLKTK